MNGGSRRGTTDKHRQNGNDLSLLFTALIPLVIIVPVLPPDAVSRVICVLFLTLLFVTGIYCLRGNRRRFLISCILALIGVECFWVSVWPAAASLFLAGEVLLLLFLLHQAGFLARELVVPAKGIIETVSTVTALVLVSGIILGTGLHIAGCIGRTVSPDPGTLHTSFAAAIPEGILLLIHGETSLPATTPLLSVLIMVGSLAGFLLLIVSAGKTVVCLLQNE